MINKVYIALSDKNPETETDLSFHASERLLVTDVPKGLLLHARSLETNSTGYIPSNYVGDEDWYFGNIGCFSFGGSFARLHAFPCSPPTCAHFEPFTVGQ